MKYRVSLLVIGIVAALVPRVAAADEVDPNVAKSRELVADYPHDRARGYAPGDIRGAFSVTWSTADVDSQ